MECWKGSYMLVVISNDINMLTGIGSEILTDIEGNFIAEFFNGQFIQALQAGNSEITKIAA